MTPIGRPVAAVRGGAAALLLELLLAEHFLGEGERLLNSFRATLWSAAAQLRTQYMALC